MDAKLRISAGPAGEEVDLLLTGSPRAILDLVERLRSMAGPVEVVGGRCCWSISGGGSSVHLVADTDRKAS
jgi:hypothetical protein